MITAVIVAVGPLALGLIAALLTVCRKPAPQTASVVSRSQLDRLVEHQVTHRTPSVEESPDTFWTDVVGIPLDLWQRACPYRQRVDRPFLADLIRRRESGDFRWPVSLRKSYVRPVYEQIDVSSYGSRWRATIPGCVTGWEDVRETAQERDSKLAIVAQ